MKYIQMTCGGLMARRRSARLIESVRGIEVRCPEHGHLLGVFVAPGTLEIKCRNDDFVVIKEAQATP